MSEGNEILNHDEEEDSRKENVSDEEASILNKDEQKNPSQKVERKKSSGKKFTGLSVPPEVKEKINDIKMELETLTSNKEIEYEVLKKIWDKYVQIEPNDADLADSDSELINLFLSCIVKLRMHEGETLRIYKLIEEKDRSLEKLKEIRIKKLKELEGKWPIASNDPQVFSNLV